jgi:hypothetical protein
MTAMNQEPKPAANGPFDWLFACTHEWDRLLVAAQELRYADNECFEALFTTQHDRGGRPRPGEAGRVRNLGRMLTSLKIKPKAVRRSYPELVGSLEAACAGCRERSRCNAELAQGTAADTYQEFCPNAQRLNALAAVQAATR